MKAVVWHGVGDIRLDEIAEPQIGKAMNKNLTIRMGNCNHRKYLPTLIELVQSGVVDPLDILTEEMPLTDALTAYKAFDKQEAGWIKVELQPAGVA